MEAMHRRGLTPEEILELIQRDSDVSDFSSEEDDDCEPSTSSQHNTEVEHQHEVTAVCIDDCVEEIEEQEPELQDATPPRRLLFRKQKFTAKPHPPPKDYNSIQNPPTVRTPQQYLSDYFSDQFYDVGALFTNMYSVEKTGKSLNITSVELKQFFGMNLIMGCIPYPRLPMYWEKGVGLSVISECMSRDRFLSIRSNLHFVDTQVPPEESQGNKLWKVQPVIEAVRSQCLKLPRNHNYYSVDEQMIPFLGRCSLKQYVKNKPRPVGLKNFVICSSTGIVIDFEIYQGDTTPLPDRSMGLGPGFVMRLVQSLPQGSFVYFDRYFTTLPLLDALHKAGIEATGTIMLNRIKGVKLKEGKTVRGECHEYVRSDDSLVVVEWKDNQKVVLASTCAGVEPVAQIKRWCKKERKYIEVDCPYIVKNYNHYMGGVDLCDQQTECYRTWFKTRKWTLKLILHFLDLSAVNCWLQYREDCRENRIPKRNIIDLLKFRMTAAQALISTPLRKRNSHTDVGGDDNEQPEKKKMKIYAPSPRPIIDKRYDGYDHWPTVDDITAPRSCRYEICKSRTKTRCVKCDQYLCLTKEKTCFSLFHIKK